MRLSISSCIFTVDLSRYNPERIKFSKWHTITSQILHFFLSLKWRAPWPVSRNIYLNARSRGFNSMLNEQDFSYDFLR